MTGRPPGIIAALVGALQLAVAACRCGGWSRVVAKRPPIPVSWIHELGCNPLHHFKCSLLHPRKCNPLHPTDVASNP